MIATELLAGGLLFIAAVTNTAANGLAEIVGCTTGDCVTPYTWKLTTVNCVLELKSPLADCRWAAGMNSRTDEKVYGGRIAAYQLQWSTGGWSDWIVPGMNDMDNKFNVNALPCSVPSTAKGLRRAWAYFYDHKHQIIICR